MTRSKGDPANTLTQQQARRGARLLQEKGISCVADSFGGAWAPKPYWRVVSVYGIDYTNRAREALREAGEEV